MRRMLVGLLLSGLIGAGCAATSGGAPAATAPAAPEPRAFLWEAQKDGAVVFLVGSIHLGRKDALALSPSMEEALASSDALVVEVDPGGADPRVMQRMVMQQGILPPDAPGLREQLDPKDAERFEAILTAAGAPVQQFDRMRPWLASISVVMLELAVAGFDPASGVDQQFLRRARGVKEIIELESMEAQLSLFSELPHEQQLLMLQETLRSDGQDATNMLTRMVEAWSEGDAATLDRELLGEMRKPEYAELYRKIFTDRNHAMAKRLKELVSASPARRHFVVVGAGHVIGDEGLVALLAKDGFTVRQVERGGSAAR